MNIPKEAPKMPSGRPRCAEASACSQLKDWGRIWWLRVHTASTIRYYTLGLFRRSDRDPRLACGGNIGWHPLQFLVGTKDCLGRGLKTRAVGPTVPSALWRRWSKSRLADWQIGKLAKCQGGGKLETCVRSGRVGRLTWADF